jgi:UDP-N-acetylmuramyl pentapeptide phosphotransferase/UDP-N-acetylglucosamine-1-phosphate transferase
MSPPSFAALSLGFAVVLAASLAATGAVLRWLRRRAILDRPNERSSHAAPVPRGGGIAVIGTALPAWIAAILLGSAPPATLLVVAGAALLATVSFLDDLRSRSAALRFAAQALAVAIGLAALPGLVFQGLLPGPLDAAFTALAWLWFVNLYNFMDGIDGITGTETACLGAGLALVAWPSGDALLAAVLAAASLGFLRWNWQPAKLFLGDVGSVSLGYLLGYLLLAEAGRGGWAAALILPLYYLADATWTLLRRLLRGERIWQAHREHFYQRAVRAGLPHAAVVRRILAADLGLIALASLASEGYEAASLPVAAAVVALLLAELGRRSAVSRRPEAAS